MDSEYNSIKANVFQSEPWIKVSYESAESFSELQAEVSRFPLSAT